ncbi:hypothetical protein [Rhizobium ruizarguesonis]|jgi:hypothetical protein|nr:hypothetical protein [Rhizobium ruizarguesonis]
MRSALRTTAQVGICALHIGQTLYPPRFKDPDPDTELQVIMKRF